MVVIVLHLQMCPQIVAKTFVVDFLPSMMKPSICSSTISCYMTADIPSLCYYFLSLFHKPLLFSWFLALVVLSIVQALTLIVIPHLAMSLASIRSTTLPPPVLGSKNAYRASSRARPSSSLRGRQILAGRYVRTFSFGTAVQRMTLNVFTVNMRFTVDQCIFNRLNRTTPTSTSRCNAPCATLSSSIQRNLQTPNASCPYDYCSDRTFIQEAQSCASCYRVIPDQIFISNCG